MNAIIWADPAVRLKKHAELMALRADNARLRAALEAAPEPRDAEVDYLDWWHGWQQPALKDG